MFLYISVQLSFFFAFCSPPSASRHLHLREGRSLVSFIFAKLLARFAKKLAYSKTFAIH